MLFVRFACTMLVIAAISLESVRAQRVYANAEQHDATFLLASVRDAGDAVSTSSLTDFSTLNVALGLLGSLGVAYQNLQFNGTKPTPHSPVIVKFSATSAVANLLGLLTLQTTKTTAGNAVGTAYTGSTLLSILGSYSSATVREVSLPGPGVAYDGMKMTLSAVVGAGLSTTYYYAFFITPPAINGVTVCSGLPAPLSVTNVQTGYQYKWYEQETGGTALATTSNGTYATPPVLTAKTFYVEAIEGVTFYSSARTPVAVSVLPKPTTPAVSMNH